jgi:cysteine-rich repeat protein
LEEKSLSRPSGSRLAALLTVAVPLAAALGCEPPPDRQYADLVTDQAAWEADTNGSAEVSGEPPAGTTVLPASSVIAVTHNPADASSFTATALTANASSPTTSTPSSSTSIGAPLVVPACGNAQSDANEACDDGPGNSDSLPNACRTDCSLPRCGDGVVDDREECDDANFADNDACTNACKLPGCGDQIVQGSEACDDGNIVNDDECSNSCTVPGCGDGIVQDPEECDDANLVNNDACTVACKLPKCGDSFLQSGEVCDDGNSVNTDSCTAACRRAACGDSILSTGEGCEDGNQNDGDGCSATCQPEVCGDAKRAGVEQCDDGNQEDNDGCSATCRNEVCGDGIVQSPREDCEDLNTVDTDVCRNGCKHAASLNFLSSSCADTSQITQTVCMVAAAKWCEQYGKDPIAGMILGELADNEYKVGCIDDFTREEVSTSQLDQCPGGRQQSPACLEQVYDACDALGYSQGFYLGTGSSGNYALACGTGTTRITKSVAGCNGVSDTSPVPVECAGALASQCGNGRGGMLQARAESNQVTYTCVDLTLTGSVRQF